MGRVIRVIRASGRPDGSLHKVFSAPLPVQQISGTSGSSCFLFVLLCLSLEDAAHRKAYYRSFGNGRSRRGMAHQTLRDLEHPGLFGVLTISSLSKVLASDEF